MRSTKVSQAKAPGKIIVSGEHAVVYGQPAIAMAINKYITVSVKPDIDISIHFLDMQFHYDCNEVAEICQKIQKRYQEYLQQQRPIQQVLHHPGELLLLILNQYPLQTGLRLTIESELAIGCGMGASAALINATLLALNDFFTQTKTAEQLYQTALNIEHHQHGHSSGLDIAMSLFGGALYVVNQQRQAFALQTDYFFVINSGAPQSSTGECVEYVKQFAEQKKRWLDFGETCEAIKDALANKDYTALKLGIQRNHRLLCQIGVVPNAIQQLIQQIEKLGFAAKISGAGSIEGNHAGMILVAAQGNLENLQQLCSAYNYKCEAIKGEPHGAQVN